MLEHEANKRVHFGGNRTLVTLVHRCMQCAWRILVNSYVAYAPILPRTWLDAHRIYAFARERGLHQRPISGDEPAATPESAYMQALLLALANPYGFLQGQLDTVIRYVQEYSHWVKLTDVAPVHRMAKAVAIIPVGHDFPPFSASKGGSIEGSKIFLLAFDLAFQIQEQVRKLEAGGDFPADVGKDMASRRRYLTLLKRLLRQWAIPPARQFNRLPSQARVVMCTELARRVAVQPRPAQRRRRAAEIGGAADALPGHQPHARGLCAAADRCRIRPRLRIGELVALRVEGRAGPAGRHRPLVSQHDARQRARIRLRGVERQSRGRLRGARDARPTASAFPWSCFRSTPARPGPTTCCRRSSSPRARSASIRAWR